MVPSRRLSPMVRAASILGLTPLLLAIAPLAPAQALDRLVILYGSLPPVTLQLQELSSFASSGQASPNLSSLFGLGNLKPEKLRTMLNTPLPISGAQYGQVIQSGLVGDILKEFQQSLGLQPGQPLTGSNLEQTLRPIGGQPQISVVQAMGALPYDSLTIDAVKLIQASASYGEQLRSLGIDLSQLGLQLPAPGSPTGTLPATGNPGATSPGTAPAPGSSSLVPATPASSVTPAAAPAPTQPQP